MSDPDTRLLRACAELIAAQAAMKDHQGAYAGPDWKAKTDGYRESWAAFVAVFNEIKGGEG